MVTHLADDRMIDARAGGQNLHRHTALLNGLDQGLARTSIRQEVRRRDAYGIARAVDQRLEKNARLGTSAMGRAENDKACRAIGHSAKAKLFGTGENFSRAFKPVLAKSRYQAGHRLAFHTKDSVSPYRNGCLVQPVIGDAGTADEPGLTIYDQQLAMGAVVDSWARCSSEADGTSAFDPRQRANPRSRTSRVPKLPSASTITRTSTPAAARSVSEARISSPICPFFEFVDIRG